MRVLITGATGLVGKEATRLFHESGIHVNYLTTSKSKIEKKDNFTGYHWDPKNGKIDERALEGVGAIVNLAGASVFQPWTASNKKDILNSRLDSLNTLYNALKENEHQVGQIISASAVGIYPGDPQKIHYEDQTEVANNFLGEVSEKWEAAAVKLQELDLRVAIIRIGIVLAADGGALPQMIKPIKYNLGAAMGSGKQWQSWIHIRDLARMILFLISHGHQGIYNAVAPNPVTNEDLTKELARALDKKLWLPNVPGIGLKLLLGEMSSVVLGSQLVSSKKIEDSGFNFEFVNLKLAVEDILYKKPG